MGAHLVAGFSLLSGGTRQPRLALGGTRVQLSLLDPRWARGCGRPPSQGSGPPTCGGLHEHSPHLPVAPCSPAFRAPHQLQGHPAKVGKVMPMLSWGTALPRPPPPPSTGTRMRRALPSPTPLPGPPEAPSPWHPWAQPRACQCGSSSGHQSLFHPAGSQMEAPRRDRPGSPRGWGVLEGQPYLAAPLDPPAAQHARKVPATERCAPRQTQNPMSPFLTFLPARSHQQPVYPYIVPSW